MCIRDRDIVDERGYFFLIGYVVIVVKRAYYGVKFLLSVFKAGQYIVLAVVVGNGDGFHPGGQVGQSNICLLYTSDSLLSPFSVWGGQAVWFLEYQELS